MKIKVEEIKSYFLNLQEEIINNIEKEDNKEKFIKDIWDYEKGDGGGITRVIKNGNVFEKGGVNFSHIKAKKLPDIITKFKPELKNYSFQAMGVSLVMHPLNPFVPISHMNVRFFIAEPYDKEEKTIWWFGGGYDLTPIYPNLNDCKYWHSVAKKACDKTDENLYIKYKKICDDYFYLPHRNETRGIGGLFFDNLTFDNNFNKSFNFVKDIGNSYLEAYLPLVKKNKNTNFTEKEKDFQNHRRSRYVEFNLVYDKGTHFGFQSNGRTESILMSMPPIAKWDYKYKVPNNSKEAELFKFLVKQDWL